MKNIIWIAFLLVAFSCGKKSLYVLDKNQPIVDLPTNSEFYSQRKTFDAALERQDKETKYLFKNKETTKDDFLKSLKNKSANTMRIVIDQSEIEKMGYDYTKIKKVFLSN